MLRAPSTAQSEVRSPAARDSVAPRRSWSAARTYLRHAWARSVLDVRRLTGDSHRSSPSYTPETHHRRRYRDSIRCLTTCDSRSLRRSSRWRLSSSVRREARARTRAPQPPASWRARWCRGTTRGAGEGEGARAMARVATTYACKLCAQPHRANPVVRGRRQGDTFIMPASSFPQQLEPPSCIEGHAVVPNEQNTQQCPALGLRRARQPAHS